MRITKSNTEKWNLKIDKTAILGCSATGEVAYCIAYSNGGEVLHPQDEIDKFSTKPDFQILIYSELLCEPEIIPTDALPVFLRYLK